MNRPFSYFSAFTESADAAESNPGVDPSVDMEKRRPDEPQLNSEPRFFAVGKRDVDACCADVRAGIRECGFVGVYCAMKDAVRSEALPTGYTEYGRDSNARPSQSFPPVDPSAFGVCGHEAVAPSALPSAPASSSDLETILRARFPDAVIVAESDYASAQVGDVVYSLTSANGVTVASRYELCLAESISGSTGQDALDALLKPMKE